MGGGASGLSACCKSEPTVADTSVLPAPSSSSSTPSHPENHDVTIISRPHAKDGPHSIIWDCQPATVVLYDGSTSPGARAALNGCSHCRTGPSRCSSVAPNSYRASMSRVFEKLNLAEQVETACSAELPQYGDEGWPPKARQRIKPSSNPATYRR